MSRSYNVSSSLNGGIMYRRKNLALGCAVAMLTMSFLVPTALAQGDPVKYVYSIDYPMGTKPEYLEWVKSVVSTLQAPEELLSIASYDAYFTSYAHRRIEYDFANAMDAAKYFARPEIRGVVAQTMDHGINMSINVLTRRGDYRAEEKKRGKVKFVSTLDYTVGGKSAYIEWVKTIVKELQAPKEIKRITSYDSYYATSPQRFIEWEFDSMEDAIRYFDLPVVKNVLEESGRRSIKANYTIWMLRGDYSPSAGSPAISSNHLRRATCLQRK
jgi:hypothetical protein